MAITIVSVSFSNGFVGDATKSNEASAASYLTALGWSNFQFQQATDNGQFGGSQGNDLSGTILITDALGVQHRIDGVINWRAPSGSVSTMVFYATGSATHSLAKAGGGTYLIDPNSEVNGDPHTFVGLTFNGRALTISGGKVTGNAATNDLVSSLNQYLAEQPQLRVGDATVDEGAGTATVTVTLDKVSSDTVTVRYASENGSANAGVDYTAVSGTLSFAPGQTSKTITVPVIDTAGPDGARTARVVLSDSAFAAIVDNLGVVTINDNDVAAAIATVIAEDAAHTGANPVDSSVVEGASLLYTVGLNVSPASPVEFALTSGGSAGAADVGAFVFSNGVAWKNNDPQTATIVVPAGVASFTITVPTTDDLAVESGESLVLSVGGVAATGAIADNDSVSVSAVLAEDAANAGAIPVDSAVIEGAALQYTVALSQAGAGPTEFALTLGGSAAAGDRGAVSFSDGVTWKNNDPATSTVVVPAGVSSFKVTVATVDDAAVEASESLLLNVGGVAATGTIADNDSVSVATVIAEDAANTGLSPADSSIVESSILRYTVHLSSAGVVDSEFALAFGGTAAPGDVAAVAFSDGVAWKSSDPASGVVVVPAGVTSFKVTVATHDDLDIELSESLVLTVGGVGATGTITDNDSPSVSSLVAEDAAHTGAMPVDSSVVEGATLLFSATLNASSPVPTEHALALGGSAAAADLGALSFSHGVAWKNSDPATGIVVVPAGVSAFTAALATADDSLIETTESAVLTLGGVAATGTISDNDSLAVSAVVAEDAANLGQLPHDAMVVEGNALVYTVTLNGVAVAPSEFSLALAGTAAAADLGQVSFSDGVAWKNGDPATGIVVIPMGVSSFKATVATVDDALVESSESAVLTVNGIHATGTLLDNDYVPPAPQPPTPPQPPVPPEPPVVEPPAPVLETGLDPDSDDGASNSDAVTSVRTPEFTVQAGQLLSVGGSVRLLGPDGRVVGSSAITAADVAAGKVNVGPGPLDDGVYTYTAQIMDASGRVVGSAPVTVTVVTDRDGVMPSVELAAYGGDYNRDGVLDWQQNGVALLPLGSLADFAKGVNAPVASFGAVIAGSIGGDQDAVQLTSGAQLRDLSLTDLPAALPTEYRAVSPVFNFTVTAAEGVAGLPDLAPDRAGLQTRVVIELGQTGVASNDFVKFDKASGRWYSFLDDQNLATYDDGATLVDLNGDGRVDRIVITLTDGARGDEDGVANGVIVDPGLLSFDKTLPDQVYSIRMAGGELYYTADVGDAMTRAAGTGNVFQGVVFDSMTGVPNTQHVSAYYQPFTQDTTYAIDGKPLPYACYELVAGSPGFMALAAGSGVGVNVHLYQDAAGRTELATLAQAAQLGLAAQGYSDRGAKFSATMDNAFTFDAEGYLIANHDNASVRDLVQQLATAYRSTSAAGFVEAVEQHYFQQIQLVGVAHGGAATAADLNTMFGTGFGN